MDKLAHKSDGRAPGTAAGAQAAAIDVEKLAERVYRLMQAEVRLAQARGERPATPRKR